MSTSPCDKRRLLIGRILQLDEKFESGAIDKDAYRLEREKLVEAVLAMEGQDESVIQITNLDIN